MTPTTHPRLHAGPRRHSDPLSFRPAVQFNCRRCHDPISTPFSVCWTCSSKVAGVRWARLAVHLVATALPIVAALWYLGGR